MVQALREELNIRRRGVQVDAVLMNVARRQRVAAEAPETTPQNLEARMTGEFSAIREDKP